MAYVAGFVVRHRSLQNFSIVGQGSKLFTTLARVTMLGPEAPRRHGTLGILLSSQHLLVLVAVGMAPG